MLKHTVFVALALVAIAGCSGSSEDVDSASDSESVGVESQAYTTCSYTPTGAPRRNFYLSNTVNGSSATVTVRNTESCRTPTSVIQTQAFCFGPTGLTVVTLDPISVPALNAYQSLSWPITLQPQCSAYTSMVDPQNTVAETNENDNSTSF